MAKLIIPKQINKHDVPDKYMLVFDIPISNNSFTFNRHNINNQDSPNDSIKVRRKQFQFYKSFSRLNHY